MESILWVVLAVFFACYVILAFAVGIEAGRNGRSALAYGFVSLFFTPIIGGGALLLSKFISSKVD